MEQRPKQERLEALEGLLAHALAIVEMCTWAETALTTHDIGKPNLAWPEGLLAPATIIAWQETRDAYEIWVAEKEALMKTRARMQHDKDMLVYQLLQADMPIHRWVQSGLYAVGMSTVPGMSNVYDLHVHAASMPLPLL